MVCLARFDVCLKLKYYDVIVLHKSIIIDIIKHNNYIPSLLCFVFFEVVEHSQTCVYSFN
jgi:hypothetical protein